MTDAMKNANVVVNSKLTDKDRLIICRAIEEHNRSGSKSNKGLYTSIIKGIAKNNHIKITKWSKMDKGLCYQESKEIVIPKPTSLSRFLTGLHEIGHIIIDKKYYPTWKSEYVCMKFEEDFCIAYNIKFPKAAKTRNRNYMRETIAACLEAGTKMESIDEVVIRYAQINVNVWNRKLKSGLVPHVKWISQYDRKIEWIVKA